MRGLNREGVLAHMGSFGGWPGVDFEAWRSGFGWVEVVLEGVG